VEVFMHTLDLALEFAKGTADPHREQIT
jgi:hypothetical protein